MCANIVWQRLITVLSLCEAHLSCVIFWAFACHNIVAFAKNKTKTIRLLFYTHVYVDIISCNNTPGSRLMYPLYATNEGLNKMTNICTWWRHQWKHFPRHWPFVRGIHRSPVNSTHKAQWRGALVFSLICTWINEWVNNREASDLRRYHAHYDVTVMTWI